VEDPEGLDALVRAARRGDASAWETLYRRAYPRLLSYARRRLPSDDAARDAVGETMARAVRGLSSGYRGEGAGFDAWLSGIVRHVVLDAQRSAGRRPVSSMVGVSEPASAAAGPEELLLGSYEAAAVRAAFASLAADDQELLELRVVHGLSSDEVAGVLGKRPGAVRMAQSRALGRLRAALSASSSSSSSSSEEAVSRHG
jgi:RNA polymerase sigma-70 factor (ECF subfamily)